MFVGAAVCIWLILLNARLAEQTSGPISKPERSKKPISDPNEQLREARSQTDAAGPKVEMLEKKVAELTEQLAMERQILQDLLDMILKNTRARAALTPAERQALERALERVRQAQDAQVEEQTSP
jgi:hypothetical protein